MYVCVCQTQQSLEERKTELEQRVDELLERAVTSESQTDILQRELTDTQAELDKLNTDTQQVSVVVD